MRTGHIELDQRPTMSAPPESTRLHPACLIYRNADPLLDNNIFRSMTTRSNTGQLAHLAYDWQQLVILRALSIEHPAGSREKRRTRINPVFAGHSSDDLVAQAACGYAQYGV